MSDKMLGAALSIAERGAFVFPIRPGGKAPAYPRAHDEGDPCRGECGRPGHGFHDATRDAKRIRAMWRDHPSAGIGIDTDRSRFLVLDLDNKGDERPRRVLREQGDDEATPDTVRDAHGVLHWLASRRHASATDLDTLTVTTPSGGEHLYFRLPSGLEVTSGAGMLSGLGWRLDVRASGGYVVCPPSTRPQGAYVARRHGPIRPAPRWLLEALAAVGKVPSWRPRPSAAPAPALPDGAGRRHAYVFRAVEGEVQRVLDATEGTRNVTLNRAAFSLGQLVGAGLLDADAAAGALLTAAGAAGLPEREAAATVRSGLRAGAQHPRS